MPFNDFAPAVVISGIGPMCPVAVAASSLIARNTGDPEGAPAPDWFRPEKYLGKRGFKYLTLATRFAAAAALVALEDAGLARDELAAAERGVFLGTNYGGAAVLDGLDAVILDAGADSLSPMTAPYFSINLVPSHISERCALTAFNVTLTSPVVAGLEAVILGAHAIQSGRAKVVVAGAAEDKPEPPGGELCELPVEHGGACAVVLEEEETVAGRAGKRYARLGATALRFFPPAAADTLEGAGRLKALLRRDLLRIVPEGTGVIALCSHGWPFAFNRRVEGLAAELLQERGMAVARRRFTGDSLCLMTASPVLQLAGLARIHGEGLVLATSPLGNIALLWLGRHNGTLPTTEASDA